MVDASLVLDAIVAVSIAAGAAFAVVELRGIGRDRRTSLVIDMMFHVSSTDFAQHWTKIMSTEFSTADEVQEKCSLTSLEVVADFFEGVGLLVRRGLVDESLVFDALPVHHAWAKMKPWCISLRGKYDATMYEHFEYAAARSAQYDLGKTT
jgi:hypothetical protein